MNIIFSDGASRGNPGPGGYGVIVATDDSVTELGGRAEQTTNNQMELAGVIEGLSYLKNKHKTGGVTIYTDSSYVVNGITKWVYGWQKNGWQTKTKDPVLNKDLWQRLVEVSHGFDINWQLLPGHAGVPGNERCDEIATSFADKSDIKLFDGDRGDYSVGLDVTVDKSKLKEKSRKNQKAYSYVSFVDGVVKTHKTWEDCEARVKGKKAKFKKVLSAVEETELTAEWTRNSLAST